MSNAAKFELTLSAILFVASFCLAQTKIDQNQAKFGSTTGPTFVDNEIPGGVVNSANSTFTLAAGPNPPSSLHLYVNGLRQNPATDYTISNSTITFNAGSIPQMSIVGGVNMPDSILVDYRH